MIVSRKKLAALFALTIGAALWFLTSPVSYKIRMTVTFDTASGPRTGTGVWEIAAGRELAILPEQRAAAVELRGEAIPVQLPGRETVYVLLRQAQDGQGLEVPIQTALDPQYAGGGKAFGDSIGRLNQPEMVGHSADLTAASWPAVVRFRNPGDPRSVRYADTADLAEFSPGTSLRRITVEVTRDDQTARIEQQLPWLRTLVGQLDGSTSVFSRDPANALSRRDFKR